MVSRLFPMPVETYGASPSGTTTTTMIDGRPCQSAPPGCMDQCMNTLQGTIVFSLMMMMMMMMEWTDVDRTVPRTITFNLPNRDDHRHNKIQNVMRPRRRR